MKALVVAEVTIDLIYLYHDDEFKQFILNKSCHEADGTQVSFTSQVQMFFAPIILSYTTLKTKLDEGCDSMLCIDGKCFVFQEYDEHLHIGMQDESYGCSYLLQVELCFIDCAVNLLYGPFGYYQLSSNSVSQKRRAWNNVTALLESYHGMCLNEPAFLFEAIEKLQLNVDVSEVCGSVLQKCTTSVERMPQIRSVQYSMLLVDGKVLSIHSRSNARKDLSTRGILEMIALVSLQAEPSKDEVDGEDENTGANDTAAEETMDELTDVDLEHSNRIYSSCDDDDVTGNDTGHDEISAQDAVSSDGLAESTVGSVFSHESIGVEANDGQSTNDAKVSIRDEHFVNHSDVTPCIEPMSCYQIPIYLTTTRSPCVPCNLYYVPVTDKTRMVFVSKAKHCDLSDVICALLCLLRKLHFTESSLVVKGGAATLQKLNRCCKGLYNRTKKLQGKVQMLGRKISGSWKKNGEPYLKQFIATGGDEFINQIARYVDESVRSLDAMYKRLFPSCAERKCLLIDFDLSIVQRYARSKLSGYTDYITVKSAQNHSMTPYLKGYPGLVHFSLVKRVRILERSNSSFSSDGTLLEDELFTPPLYFPTSNPEAAALLKRLKNKFRKYVTDVIGDVVDDDSSTHVIIDGDFVFSSHLVVPNRTQQKQSISGETRVVKAKPTLPTLFSGQGFYSNICASSPYPGLPCHVFHLFCVHFAVVPHEVIKQQHGPLLYSILEEVESSVE